MRVLREDDNKKILAEKSVSNHPADEYLTIVMAQYKGRYVTWICNYSYDNPCYTGGHYFGDNFEAAMQDFYERG